MKRDTDDTAPAPSVWSDELRVMRRPYRTYRVLSARPDDAGRAWRLLRGPALMLLMVGAFVSLTSTGRLVWYHMLFPAVAWAFMPLWQIVWVAILRRAGPDAPPLGRQIDLYYRGQGPWYLWMALLVALCLFTPHARLAFYSVGIVLAIVSLITVVWSVVLTHAYFRAALDHSRGGAAWRTAVFYVGLVGIIIAYYTAAGGQIQALLS